MSTGVLRRPATAMNQSRDPQVLGTIAMQGVAVAIWQREADADMLNWLAELPADRLPRLRETLRPDDAARAVASACNAAGTPPDPQRARFIADIAELAQLAADRLGAAQIYLRLDVGAGQPCPKFHLDAVRARLLCTLRGTGTQFGPVRPDGDIASVHQMPTGAVGLFRGRMWPDRQASGILHRSPPAVPGQTRLLVVIDPADEAGLC